MELTELVQLLKAHAPALKDSETVSGTMLQQTAREILDIATQLKADCLKICMGGTSAKDAEREAAMRLRTLNRLCGKLKLSELPPLMTDQNYEFHAAVEDVGRDCQRMVEQAIENKPPERTSWGDEEQARAYTAAAMHATAQQQTNEFRLNDAWNRLWHFAEELERAGPLNQGTARPTSPTEQVQPRIFFSYSHKDAKWLKELQTMLKPAVNADLLWDDTKIKAGDEWRKEIRKALTLAKVAVLLVSDHFLASDFIGRDELPPLLEAAKKKGLTILWVHVSASMYQRTAIEAYQATHNPAYPLDTLRRPKRKQVLVQICETISAAAKHLA